MNRKHSLILKAGLLAFIPILSTLSTQPAAAQFARFKHRAPGGPTFVAGQILLYCQPNTPQADVTALAALAGAAHTTPLRLADAYRLNLPDANKTAADTLAAVAALKGDPRVRWVSPDLIPVRFQTTTPVTPNDPLYTNGEQWGLNQINMPLAWALQKGTANVADIDTGVDQTIADLTGQYLADSYNTADNTTDITANPTTSAATVDNQHGVGTSGVMIAKANNSIGIASVCGWGATKCLFLKDETVANNTSALSYDVDAFAYILSKATADNVVAINVSWGYEYDPGDTTNPLYAAVLNCQNAGIITCVSAGNEDTTDTTSFIPGGYPFVVTVSATGPTGKKASYSSYGKVQVAAPGGEFGGTIAETDPYLLGDGSNGILTTWDAGYHFVQGTSFSAPHTAALVTLLRSVPGVTPQQVFDPNNLPGSVLLNTANSTLTGQTTVPDQYYGYGIIDAYAALEKVSTGAVIVSPIGINPVTGMSTGPAGQAPPPVETLRPTFTFSLRNIPLSNVNIVLQQANGTNIPIITNGAVDPAATNLVTSFQVTGTTTGTFPQYTISFRYEFTLTASTAQETIVLTGTPTDPTLPTAKDTRIYTLAPHQFQSGLSMISIPYYESATDSPAGRLRSAQEILGLTSVALYRWVNVPTINTNGASTVEGQYASNGTGADIDPALATLEPTDQPTTLLPTLGLSDVSPIGNGYFLNIPSGALVETYGQQFQQNIVRIPIHEGWNIVGDPFSFAVAFGGSEIETSDGNRQTISEAVQNNLVLPYIYSYIASDYQLQQLPNGSYQPWQSHWIYVVPKNPGSLNANNTLTLLIPPTAAPSTGTARATLSSSNNSGPTVIGPGSWHMRLAARSKTLSDSYNYIGMSSNATNGNDITKAPKPPKMSPSISLGMSRAANGGLYAQDLRPIGGTQTWEVVVTTDQKAADITVQWPDITSVPRHYQLMLTDTATNQTFDMRSLPAYQFHATAQQPAHKFTITATPDASAGRAVLADLVVNPSRTKSVGTSVYEISYNLSRSASVEVSVLGTNGRVVSLVSPSRSVTQGVNRAYWDGHDNSGRPVQSGTYVLQVRAQTPDGQVTRQIQPMTLIGR